MRTRGGQAKKRMIRFWTLRVSGDDRAFAFNPKARNRKIRPVTVTKMTKIFAWSLVGLLSCAGIYQIADIQKMLGSQAVSVTFFDDDVIVDVDRGALPVQINRFKCISFENIDRGVGSELGQRSDTWGFEGDEYRIIAALDQPFPGWHELTTCYKNQGWKVTDRKTISNIEGQENGWAYVEVKMEKATGEHGYLMFSFFDVAGQPWEAPEDWGAWTSFWERVKNRGSYRLRSRLFRAEAYQNQVFVVATQPLTKNQRAEVSGVFFQMRETLRKQFQEKSAG